MAKRDLDKASSAYVARLHDLSDFEKQALVDRAEYDPKQPDAYQKQIKKRVKKIEDLEGADVQFGDLGWSHLRPFPRDIVPAYGGLVPFEFDLVRCDFDQTLEIPTANYVLLGQNPSFGERAIAAKTAHARASANPYHWDTWGMIHNGFRTTVTVPASTDTTSVTVTSGLVADFGWVEANAIGNNWVSSVVARGLVWLSGPAGIATAPSVLLVSFNAANGQVLSHNDMPTTTLEAVFELRTSVPPGGGASIEVFETELLQAATPNGHAYIGGTFTWQPLIVSMRGGCRIRPFRRWGYWGRA